MATCVISCPFRVVIGGVIAVATRAVFKPLSYLTACYLLNADAAKLKEEANDINNKKKLAAELSYKVNQQLSLFF